MAQRFLPLAAPSPCLQQVPHQLKVHFLEEDCLQPVLPLQAVGEAETPVEKGACMRAILGAGCATELITYTSSRLRFCWTTWREAAGMRAPVGLLVSKVAKERDHACVPVQEAHAAYSGY